jgi:hypothetical protein
MICANLPYICAILTLTIGHWAVRVKIIHVSAKSEVVY